LWQLTISFAMASDSMSNSQALHQSCRVKSANPYNPVFQNTLAKLTGSFAAAGPTQRPTRTRPRSHDQPHGHAADECPALA
jgi:hypothetical protein